MSRTICENTLLFSLMTGTSVDGLVNLLKSVSVRAPGVPLSGLSDVSSRLIFKNVSTASQKARDRPTLSD